MKMRLLGLFALCAFSALSQPITFGVKGGVPLTDFIDTTPPEGKSPVSSTTNPYIVGSTMELRLPRNFSVEFDALFRHYRFQTAFHATTHYDHTSATTGAWEFPLLVKYRLPGRLIGMRPYIDGGVAWDQLQGLSATIFTADGLYLQNTTTSQTSSPGGLSNRTSTGIVIGGGLDIHAHRLDFSPEIRYTRWTFEHFYISNQNQAEFLLGITF